MPRLGSRGCVLALLGLAVLACNKHDAGTGALGSPSAAAAGREAASSGAKVERKSNAGNTGGLARSLVAVAATSPSDAQPCERTCGRVGDCLLETRDVGEFEAGRLELSCLDLCVHSPESDANRTAFLACERQSGCGELLGCARSNWDALAASHVGPLVQGVTVGGNSCAESCLWLYSCFSTGMPPGQAYLGPEYEESMRSCEMQCEASPTDRDMYTRLADCLRSNCASDRQQPCYELF